jgi:hypothetical protein
VQVLVDGATHPDIVVSATGTWTINYAASVVHLGYAYQSDGQCLRFEAGSATGTAQGKFQRSHIVIFRVYDTLGLSIGPSFTELNEVTFRTAANLLNQPVPLFTGDVGDDSGWDGSYTTENYICWRFASPLPGTVVAIMPQMITQDR